MATITDLIRVAGWQDSGQEIWQAFGLRASGQRDNEGTGQDEDVDYQPVNAYLDSVGEWDTENAEVVERYRADLERWRNDPDNVPRPDLPVLPDAPLLDVALLPIMAVASPPLAAALAIIRLVGRAYLAYRQARLQSLAQQDMLEALQDIARAVEGLVDALSACSVEIETEKAAKVRLSGVETFQGSVPFPTNL